MASCDNSTDEDVGQVMQRVWGALDRLAESDPEAYKKFIDQQMKEGREQMCQPEPVFCLQCDVTREGVREGGREEGREGVTERGERGREGMSPEPVFCDVTREGEG